MKKAILILLAVILLMQIAVVLAEKRVFAYQGNVAFFLENGRMGLMDDTGNVLHKAEFVSAKPFDVNNLAHVYLADGRQGYIDKDGNWVVQPMQVDYLGYVGRVGYMETLYNVILRNKIIYKVKGKMGLISLSGEMLLPAEYDSVLPVAEDKNYVRQNKKMWLVDDHGNRISPLRFEGIDADTLLGIIERDGERKYYDLNGACLFERVPEGVRFTDDKGNTITSSAWDDLFFQGEYKDGYIAGKKDDMWGVMDLQGNTVVEPEWGNVIGKKDYLFLGGKDGSFYSYDMKTKRVINLESEEDIHCMDFENEYVLYGNGKTQYWGYMDYGGNILSKISPEYVKHPADEVSEGFIITQKGEQVYYFDMQGNYITSKDWEFGLDFQGGLARVRVKGKYGFINTKGELVVAAVWEDAGDFSSITGPAVALVYKGGKPYGWINTRGELLCLYSVEKKR